MITISISVECLARGKERVISLQVGAERVRVTA
jgi:hypothetical protein